MCRSRVAQNLSKLRDTFLPKLISGELRLPEAVHLIEMTQYEAESSENETSEEFEQEFNAHPYTLIVGANARAR